MVGLQQAGGDIRSNEKPAKPELGGLIFRDSLVRRRAPRADYRWWRIIRWRMALRRMTRRFIIRRSMRTLVTMSAGAETTEEGPAGAAEAGAVREKAPSVVSSAMAMTELRNVFPLVRQRPADSRVG